MKSAVRGMPAAILGGLVWMLAVPAMAAPIQPSEPAEPNHGVLSAESTNP